ncbi:unnamed protein product [Rhizophagus irregularis]|nr:unnamed protein product [Rhizophagus irregularis]
MIINRRYHLYGDCTVCDMHKNMGVDWRIPHLPHLHYPHQEYDLLNVAHHPDYLWFTYVQLLIFLRRNKALPFYLAIFCSFTNLLGAIVYLTLLCLRGMDYLRSLAPYDCSFSHTKS